MPEPNCHHCSTQLKRGDCPKCNPYRFRSGDRAILPDGRPVTISRAGFYLARFDGHPPLRLNQLRPIAIADSKAESVHHYQLSLI